MMRIGEVARRVGLRTSAVRYYERLGLLPVPGRSSGRRHYDEGVIARLRVIRFARGSAFTLREIRTLLTGRPYSGQMRSLACDKIAELDQAIERAQGIQAVLKAALRCRCLTAEECGRRIGAADQPAAISRSRRAARRAAGRSPGR